MGASTPPPFPSKLYSLVDDVTTDRIVSWDHGTGSNFTVHDQIGFARIICPRYFKHNNFQSFQRQLNQYGFRKKDAGRCTFGHDKFIKGRKDLLGDIERRRPPNAIGNVYGRGPGGNAMVEVGNYGIVGELQALKRDKDILVKELMATRDEEKNLQDKCTSLERRVDGLDTSSKQLQNFIIHYFSQVLHPYRGASVERRKRKRLMLAKEEDEDEGSTLAMTSFPQNTSLEVLREMLRKIQVSTAAPVPSASDVDSRSSNPQFAPQNAPPQPYPPLMIQEVSDQNTASAHSSCPNLAANEDGTRLKEEPQRLTELSNTQPEGTRSTTTPVCDSMEIDSGVEHERAINAVVNHVGDTNEMKGSSAGAHPLENKQHSAARPPQSRCGPVLQRARHSSTGLNGSQEMKPEENHSRLETKAENCILPAESVKEEPKMGIKSFDEFLNLRVGESNLNLFPPLAKLPQGTDMGALARRIEEISKNSDPGC